MYQEIRYEVKAYKSDEGLSLQFTSNGNTTVASCFLGRSQGWRLTPSEVAQALRSAAASGSYIAEPTLGPAK